MSWLRFDLRRRRAWASAAFVVLVLCVAGELRADDRPARRFTGAFSGTGRSCYGRLYVKTKTISWLTPFSQCRQVAYRLIEQHEDGNVRAFAFELVRRPKDCRYGVIYLRHADDPDQKILWEVIGYASLDGFRADQARGFKADSATSMSCYLVAE